MSGSCVTCHSYPQHDMTVLSVDWGHKTNRIVSCSEDRTAYVWTKKKGKWEPELVVLGPACTYAGLCCKWCESEDKFVVGTGSSQTHVCYHDDDNNWWMSKAAKGHTSSVTAVAWMPQADSLILATGSTDCKLNLMSGYVKPVDGKVANPGKVGTLMATKRLGGWVHSIAFTPDAEWLAAVSHDSCITFLETSGTEYDNMQTLPYKGLPFLSVAFVSNDTCIAVGHEFAPQCYKLADGNWAHKGTWIEEKKEAAKKDSMGSRAMAMFQDQAKFGEGNVKKTAKTKHNSTVAQIQVLKSGSSFSFSTCGFDGAVHIFTAGEMVPAS
eukprot:TRINITY_DN13738_c0_g1_i1.p1 TRINITY_DN13738_c0_g1~~TRINITY_DN13738_c0_g1_i1.p1  ORF type:complete len:325 (+),score=104.93 TRINITY_DN13738_c0_g1_i1:26-1000(+)